MECNPAYVPRIIPAMYAYFTYLSNQLAREPPLEQSYPWTWVRIADMQWSIEWLYDNYPTDAAHQQLLRSGIA